MNDHLEKIKNCCENKESDTDSSFIARLQIKYTSEANELYEKNKEYFEYGEKLMDPLKKESAIDDIAKYEQRAFPKKVRRIRSKLIKEIANLELRVIKFVKISLNHSIRLSKGYLNDFNSCCG